MPNHQVLFSWARENGIKGDLSSLCNSEAAKKVVLSSMKEIADRAQLKPHERVSVISLEPTAFSQQGLVTSSSQLKRKKAAEILRQ